MIEITIFAVSAANIQKISHTTIRGILCDNLGEYSTPSLKRIANPFYRLADGIFRCRAFNGEGVG